MRTSKGILVTAALVLTACGAREERPVATEESLVGERARLTASDARENAWFGYRAVIDGDTVAVGAVLDDASRGAVYVFERHDDAWEQVAEFVGESIAASLGGALALHGDTLVAGAFGDDGAGAVFVYARGTDGWSLDATLRPDDGAAEDFGFAVGLSGETLVVGAPSSVLDGREVGAAYVYERDGDGFRLATRFSVGEDGDWFGASAAIDGDTVLIGAREATGAARGSGVVYFFERVDGVWGAAQRLAPEGAAAGEELGFDVSLSGDVAVAGAPGADDARGAAYLFAREGGAWRLTDRLVDSSAGASRFGVATLLREGTLLVGCEETASLRHVGGVHVFERDASAWFERQLLRSREARAFDFAGRGLGFDGTRVVVGAPFADAAASDGGAVDLFEPTTCGNGVLDEGEACDGEPCCTDVCELAFANTVCRRSTGPCDPFELCTGVTAACRADITDDCDAAASDDAGPILDASSDPSPVDAASGGPTAGGCACSVASPRARGASSAAASLVALLALLRARRLRRSRPRA